MKNRKFPNTAKYAVFGVLAVAVVVSSMYGGSDLSKTLKTAVIGDYGYTSAPINYQARNFACYPGPVQPNNGTKYAGTYNTYMFNYGEAYANSGVKGTWCTGYLPSISQDPTLYDDPPLKTSTTNTPTDHTTAYINAAVYKVTDANGQEDVTNPMYRRWLAHKNAAQIHENKVVFYENTLAGYGTYYTTGNSYGGNTALDPNGSGLYGYSVVHCPAGAIVVDHATTASLYKAAASSRHYLSSPTDENGLYDGSGHKWCELNGVSVNPVAGPETGKSMPDFASDKSMLFKFTFPNGSGGSADYYKYHNTWNSLGIASANSDWVKCDYGTAGPFVEGANNHYISPYDSQTNQNKAKTPHYHCLSQSGAGYTEPVKDTVGPPAPYNTWTFLGGIMYSENTCTSGDATCGGAGTIGATGPCSRGTYYYQTTDAGYRRCLASATPASDTFTPPAPTWTINPPTFLRILGTKMTGFGVTESVPIAASFAAMGTGISFGQATLTVQIAQDTSFATAWIRPSSTGNVFSVSSDVYGYIDNFPATGTFYWRAKMALGTQESAWSSAPYPSFVVCSADKTWNGTSCVVPTVAVCALDIKLNDNKTTYTKGDMVNYTYSCTPAGTKAASVTVQVVKPDGTATTYNSGTNIDTATLGFSTSNLDAGNYTIRACLNSTCTSGIASVNFTIGTTTVSGTTTTAGPTLNGTIYKDGQYVDPATFILRNCVSPSYWMKEGSTTSGARGFHCMPYTPSYTLTSDHYPPASCTGTLWAGSDTAGFSADYCATSKSTTGTVSGTSEPTLMGTIFKDGQYVDPVTYTLRNCVSPNAWMKESPTSSGARGFHCMPNYTATSSDYPPASCTGTLWAGYSGGSSTTAVAPDYCAVTKDTNGTISGGGTVSGGTVTGGPKACGTGEKCASGSWCSNGKQCYYPDGAITCAAWTMGGNSSCATVAPGTKECSPTDTNCINPGDTGPANGWCSNSMECFTSDGNKKFCQAYSNTPGVQTSCPVGSKLCSSTDTNCIEPGATGSLTGWCKNSMECFTADGAQKFCQAYSNTPGTSPSCPAGSKLCGNNDINCIEPGATGPVDGWCKNSMECYSNSKDSTKKYCQSWNTAGSGLSTSVAAVPMMMSCPAEYPKTCRPNEKNCTEIGETNPNSGAWCSAGGKQCYKGDGSLYCAKQDETCPKDSKKCPTNTYNNPVAYSSFTSQCIEDEGPIDGWCGGSSAVQCYKNDGKTKKCLEVLNSYNDPSSWESVSCPTGYNRCAPNSPGCLGSIGAKGKSGDWCMVGMTRDNGDGTITCVSMKSPLPEPMPGPGIIPPKPLPELCVSGTATIAYDPATFNCKTFASSCGVPENWLTVNDGRVCQDGKLVNFNEIDGDDASFKKILEEKRKYLKDLGFRLVALPAYVSGIEPVKVLINDAEVVIKGIYQYFPTKSEANRKIVRDKVNSLIKDTLPAIETQMNSLNVYVNFNDLAVEIRRDLQRYKIILENADDLIFKKADPRSEYYEKLREGVARLESLLKNAETSTGDVLAQLTTVIKTQWHDLQALVDGQSENLGDDFLEDTIDGLNEALEKFEVIIVEKNINMPFVLNHMEKLRKLMFMINEIDVEEATNSDRQRVNEAVKFRDKLALWLDERPVQDLFSVDKLMDMIDKKVTEAMDKAMAKLENKLEMMMDEQLKQVTIKLTELTEKVVDKFSSKFAELVAQNTNNLAAVPEAQKEILAQDTTRILDRTEALVASVDNSNLSSFEKEGLLGTMETIATHTWCGDYAQKIQSELNSTGLALEADQLTAGEVSDFDKGVDGWIVENQGECYKAGATPGMDVPMESWYHPYTMYNFTRGYMHGYGGDQAGNFGPANATLRIEALAMIMRLLNIPLGDYSEPVGYMGVPSWLNKDGLNEANTYVNGAVSFLDKSWNMSQPITRAETARLFVAAMTSLDKPYIDLPTVFDAARRYTDYAQFSDDKDATIAIEALTDAGIFKGAGDGGFHPYDSLLRSEFAAINQRVVETFDVQAGSSDSEESTPE